MKVTFVISRPYGTWLSHRIAFPAMNRWATFDCPYGAETPQHWMQSACRTALTLGRFCVEVDLAVAKKEVRDQLCEAT